MGTRVSMLLAMETFGFSRRNITTDRVSISLRGKAPAPF
jgi:hypothetical protein